MKNELNLTPELLEKAKTAPSSAALLALAQENGIALTNEEATLYFAQLHPEAGALSDEELDNVAGGGLCGGDPCPNCSSTDTKSSGFDFECNNCHRKGIKHAGGKITLWD